jgi:putative endonuclease
MSHRNNEIYEEPPPRSKIGKIGEEAAQAYLARCGYRLVGTNVRFGSTSGLVGELDIVAWDGETLCFIEVKTRRGNVGRVAPAESVTPAKQRQIARLALAYVTLNGLMENGDEMPMRFDVVAVYLAADSSVVPRCHLLRGAFVAPDGFEEG